MSKKTSTPAIIPELPQDLTGNTWYEVGHAHADELHISKLTPFKTIQKWLPEELIQELSKPNNWEIDKIIIGKANWNTEEKKAKLNIRSNGLFLGNEEIFHWNEDKKNWRAIGDIKNPSEKVQLAAVGQDWHAIKYIKNPSKEVQLAAVERKDKPVISHNQIDNSETWSTTNWDDKQKQLE